MNLEEVLLNKIRESAEADEAVLSDRTIKDTIEIYGMPEEEKVDEFVEKLTPLFKTVAGQSRALLSKAKEERNELLKRIEQNKNKPQIKDTGVPQEDQNEGKNPKEEVENKSMEAFNAVLETVKTLKEEISTMKKADALKSRKSELLSYMKDLGCSDTYVLKQALNKVDIEAEDIDSLKKELEKAYTTEYKACREADAPNLGGSGGNDATSTFLEMKFKEMEAEKEYKPKFD